MFSAPSRRLYLLIVNNPKLKNNVVNVKQVRGMKIKKPADPETKPRDQCDGCRRALVDIPQPVDPDCPHPCKRDVKPPSILQKIKLKIIEGGTNFGTPFRFLDCKELMKKETGEQAEVVKKEEESNLPVPKTEIMVVPEVRPGVQVTLLGAEPPVGKYLALMLKQCPGIKKIRLYDAKSNQQDKICPSLCEICARDGFQTAQDLQHIDTNCIVQAYSADCNELEISLQSADIVVMLEPVSADINALLACRFQSQAPNVKTYAEAISRECPKAFVVVCASPIDCMVPLVAEILKETGWYDRRKLIGSVAAQEMRASTIAARALTLEPQYTRVPCVGGTEGDTLVPLFSKALEDFDFPQLGTFPSPLSSKFLPGFAQAATYINDVYPILKQQMGPIVVSNENNAEVMTNTVRKAPWDLAKCQCCCVRSSNLSEAHALANLVRSISHALNCEDVPKVSGFVETDNTVCISPARFMALELLLGKQGICKTYDIPGGLTDLELEYMDTMFRVLTSRVNMARDWYASKARQQLLEGVKIQKDWNIPTRQSHLEDCSLHLSED